ncbi:MAG: transglutaminase TgpA family protein [Pontibacterium sp.]
MKPAIKPLYYLSRTALVWQLAAIIGVVIPHLTHLPLWVPGIVLGAIGWRLMVHAGRWSFPHWSVRMLFALAGCAAVLVSFGGITGVSSMVALLVVGFGLKSLEVYRRRDALLVVYVAYLVAGSALLFNQSLWMAAIILLTVIVTTAALTSLYQTRDAELIAPLRLSSVLIAQALPLMLVLFILMPRIGPLWAVKIDLGSARTGLSDEMVPGDITRLTRSSEVAFRVSFDGAPPPQHQLYWRAMTYPDFDGRRWYQEENFQVAAGLSVEFQGTGTPYAVMLEATGQHYIPALDLPVKVPGAYQLKPDMTLISERPVESRRQYKLVSAMDYQLMAGTTLPDRARQLALPANNPKSRQKAQQWYQEAGDTEAYIRHLMHYFNQQFSYTLSPPKLGQNGIDEFLFTTQTGFCGHFSGAMVFMLRAAGIPARVVAGYQGGEWNPYEAYLLVRQYDAHAWVEAWLPEKGWVRFDPTAAVAPERVERPSDELFAAQADFLKDAPFGSYALGAGSWLSDVRLQWDALNFVWQRWAVNYHLQQNKLLKQLLGEVTPLRLALALLIPFALVMAFVALRLLWQRQTASLPAIERALKDLSERLIKEGLARQPGETVKQYCTRLSCARPDLAPLLSDISSGYEQLRYAEQSEPAQAALLLSMLKRCRARV